MVVFCNTHRRRAWGASFLVPECGSVKSDVAGPGFCLHMGTGRPGRGSVSVVTGEECCWWLSAGDA